VRIVPENDTVCRVHVDTRTNRGKELLYRALFKNSHNWYEYTTWLRVKPGVALATDSGNSFYHRGRNNDGWFVLYAPTRKALEADMDDLLEEFS